MRAVGSVMLGLLAAVLMLGGLESLAHAGWLGDGLFDVWPAIALAALALGSVVAVLSCRRIGRDHAGPAVRR